MTEVRTEMSEALRLAAVRTQFSTYVGYGLGANFRAWYDSLQPEEQAAVQDEVGRRMATVVEAIAQFKAAMDDEVASVVPIVERWVAVLCLGGTADRKGGASFRQKVKYQRKRVVPTASRAAV